MPERPRYFNRELSWLDFNARVLHEAFDERNPLLDRLKFIAIFSTNLDEFYMVRIAGLRRQLAAGVEQPSAEGVATRALLDAINRRIAELMARQRTCLHDLLLPALAEHGIRLVTMNDLQPAEWQVVDEFFESQVFPVLTPLAFDPGHPFPYISNLSLSLAVQVFDPQRGSEHFARVKVPKSLPRWVPFGRPHHFVPLEQVIGANLGALFPGMEIRGWHAFRVTRYSDLELAASDDTSDLLAMMEEQVFQRRFAEVVRVELQDGTPPALRALLREELAEQQDLDTDDALLHEDDLV
ncbi:MAG: RNA degradosome polyphosphate kinase, partial [Gemmatimonadaceae bacterium]